MQVTVKYRSHLAELTKAAVESIEASTENDVLMHIKTQFGAEAEKEAKTMLIVVNGQSVLHLSHFKTALKDGDEVSFLPISGGG
jgi:MoaD family protein